MKVNNSGKRQSRHNSKVVAVAYEIPNIVLPLGKFEIVVSYDERFDYSGIASSHEDRHKQVPANIKTANLNSRATAKY